MRIGQLQFSAIESSVISTHVMVEALTAISIFFSITDYCAANVCRYRKTMRRHH